MTTIPEATTLALQTASTRAATAFRDANQGALNVSAALVVADSIGQLRSMLDAPEVRQRVEALRDCPIGFRTDRDPKIINSKTQKPNEPYGWDVTRDCALEASMRGLQLVGNHFNILAGRCYVTKEGLEYLVRSMDGVTDFRPVIGIPKNTQSGMVVECSATWKQFGKEMAVSAVIPVKSDQYSFAEQLMGKASRKLLARAYAMMSGVGTPDGDAGDVDVAQLQNVTPSGARTIPIEAPATVTETVVTPPADPPPEPSPLEAYMDALVKEGIPHAFVMRKLEDVEALHGASGKQSSDLSESDFSVIRNNWRLIKRAWASEKMGGAK